ncbi:hypothetical protein SKAU_G00136670 [Synaphobranchus kaupii]|uniref:Gypsy retrotransposon integrase-like protein 1 n=1 Tax=Synaphobranchus kaupii TaxID=118154 RepID=A0A9Q1J3K9_SYNKA|nr:hypothetical protein SKAU_G00136670 [Synaphobranchus kaupii]
MAALNLSQPTPFLQSVGEPPVPFKAWIRTFENYLLAMSEVDLPDARKRALLIHCLGAEGQRLFYTLTVADEKYDTAREAIQNFFTPKVNVVAERYRFRQRSQRPGETTDQFVAALKELVTTCQFGTMEEEMIRDQLVEKTNSARIRERLLMEVPLTLSKATTIARQIETAVTEAKAMCKGAADSAVHAVHEQGPQQYSKFTRGKIVTTRKDRPDIRLCVDLREPNKAVVIDGFPLPHMEEMFAELRGATLFSTLDLQSAYHQVPLHEDSRSLTTFITHDGLFRFKRVPFGLASGPSCFQRMMSSILKDLQGVQCYLDDIIVSAMTAEEHDKRLTVVLWRIESAGLKLNLSKCNFRKTELSFLGHTVSEKGLQPDASHVTAVSQAPPPTDLIKLRSFLGLTSWYSKFIPDYAAVVEPLRALLHGSDTFTWSPEAQRSFETVKGLIVNSPALSLFNPALPTVVTTDASDYGLGAVLTQMHQDGSERTVAFASRTLTQAERNYSTVEKEALGCVWATEKWRTYLWGRHFTLRTDHSPLTTLLASKGQGRAGMRIARWSSRLLSFNYDIQYKPGRENVTADCLSRLPLPNSEPSLEDDVEIALTSALTAVTEAEFKAACTSCPVQTKLRQLLTSRWPKSAKSLAPNLQPFFKLMHELSLQEDCVVRGTHRLLVPNSLQPKLISRAHDTHQGIVRTKQRLREVYWWPGMDAQVEAAIKACITCQSHDKSAVTHTTPLQPVPFPEGAWEKLAIDIVGPFDKAPIDCRFAITLIDYHSKWPEIAFVPNVTSRTVIQFLSAVFSREGDPKELVSDNGSQFVSQEFDTFLQDRGIVHRKSSVYYPRANGEIERFNRSLKDSLQTALLEGKPWKEFTRDFLHVYRATAHSTTQRSPAELLHGRPMRTKLHVAGRPLPQSKPLSSEQVAFRVGEKQKKSKAYTDHKRGAKGVFFQCGSYVRVRKPGILPKNQCKFTRPLRVVEKKGQYTTCCQMDDAGTHPTLHLPHCRRRRVTVKCYLWTLKPQQHQLHHKQLWPHHLPDRSGPEEHLIGLRTLCVEKREKGRSLTVNTVFNFG